MYTHTKCSDARKVYFVQLKCKFSVKTRNAATISQHNLIRTQKQLQIYTASVAVVSTNQYCYLYVNLFLFLIFIVHTACYPRSYTTCTSCEINPTYAHTHTHTFAYVLNIYSKLKPFENKHNKILTFVHSFRFGRVLCSDGALNEYC